MDQMVFTGVMAGVFSALSLIHPLIKLLKQKQADNISQPMLVILFLGLSCWIYYGILHKDWIIIISNSFSVFMNLLILLFTIKYRHKTGSYKELFNGT